jgi:hypothetical protein
MKHLVVSLTIGACLLVPSAGMTLAGQPGTNAGQNCNLTTGPVPGGLTGGAATTSVAFQCFGKVRYSLR